MLGTGPGVESHRHKFPVGHTASRQASSLSIIQSSVVSPNFNKSLSAHLNHDHNYGHHSIGHLSPTMMAIDDFPDDGSEGSPLLDPEIDDDAPEPRRRAWYQPSTPAGVVGLMTFIIFVMTLSGTMSLIPLGRLIEDVVCRKHYETPDPVEEHLCKVDAVQTKFAWLGGLYVFINSIIGASLLTHCLSLPPQGIDGRPTQD